MAKKFSLADYMEPASKVDRMEITMVPFERIAQNWRNFYAVDVNEQDLAESIKVSGLLTPLGVVPGANDGYRLISGHRRWRALRWLRDSEPDGRERWATVPCVVYATPEDADREELMLIHANAQRVKSGPEIAKEAQKTTEILCRMKEAGVELPGRMRDRVAEALQISSTRVARLDAIEHNLTYPGWQRKWQEEKVNEAVAYRLSQLSYDEQMNAADYVIDKNIPDNEITVRVIEDALAHPPLANPGCADPLAYEEDPVKVDRELVRRMGALEELNSLRHKFEGRKDGISKLKTAYRNAGHSSPGLKWDGEPTGIRFREPLDWHLGWGAMYDAMAIEALAEEHGAVSRPAPAAAEPASRDPMEAPTVTVCDRQWRSCRDDPPKGWTLAFKFYPWDADDHDYDMELVQYHDGKWYGVYSGSDQEIEITMYDLWLPAAPIPAGAWE